MARLKGANPGCGVEFVLHMRVAMLGAAHESRAPNHLPAGVGGNDLFAPQPVLCGNNRTLVETMADVGNGLLHLSRLGRHDAQIAIGELLRPCRCLERHMKLMFSRYPQAVAI